MLHRLKSSNHFMAFFVQVCATSMGILIALGLDQWKTHRQQQATVQQARTFMVRELQTNRTEVHKSLEKMKNFLQVIGAIGRLVEAESKGPVPMDSPLRIPFKVQELGYSIPELSIASWEAGMANQAISHMPNAQVESLASAFTLQKRLQELHSLLLQKTPNLIRVIYLVGMNPKANLSPSTALELHLQLQDYLLIFQSTEESTREIKSAYDTALTSCGVPKP